jgi:glycosyltransferase involved in cell wall biosynthesis
MNILICSYCFHPSVGGIETVSRVLAEEFTKAGATVTVLTDSVGGHKYPYKVVRQANASEVRSLGKQADLIFQNNISLKSLFPLLCLGKPIVVAHHTWLTRVDGRIGWQDRLKRLLLRLVHNVAISRAIADALPVPSIVIGNPFEQDSFSPFRHGPKPKDIVFLVS